MADDDGIEMRWIEAWNDVYEIVGDRWDVKCLLPSGEVVDEEACRGWLQEMVYDGMTVRVAEGWVLGRRGIVVTCNRTTESRKLHP